MDQLTKLIEQWCGDDQDSARGFIELFNYDKKQAKSWTRFVEFLASHPTCGEEQRKFLDEIEKTYKFKDMGMGVLIKKKNWRHDVTEIMQKDFAADLSKVIKGD